MCSISPDFAFQNTLDQDKAGEKKYPDCMVLMNQAERDAFGGDVPVGNGCTASIILFPWTLMSSIAKILWRAK